MQFQELVRARCSERHFGTKPIEKSEIEAIIEDASWSPSAGNRQPWRVVALSPESAATAIERFEPLSWEILYPVLRTVIENDSAFVGKKLSGSELTRATVDLVQRELFVRGSPWLLIVYFEKPRVLDRLRAFAAAARMIFHRVTSRKGLLNKLRLATFVMRSFGTALRTDDNTTLASVTNFIYALHLSAHDRGYSSCIQFTYALVEPQLKKALAMPRSASILGAVVIGQSPPDGGGKLKDRVRERKPVPIHWH